MRRFAETETPSSVSTLAEINMTPLLDLAFVLLVIFMITAPFLAESADLTLPSSDANREAVDPASVSIISIDREGRLQLNAQDISEAALAERLIQAKAEDPGLAVLIRADQRLSVQDVVNVMDVLKTCEITKVGLVTKPAGS